MASFPMEGVRMACLGADTVFVTASGSAGVGRDGLGFGGISGGAARASATSDGVDASDS